jgi:alpha-beta hydrolase superfamily lysophospholipase
VPDDEPIDQPKTPEAAGFSRHIAVFIEDSALWPLLFIFVVHVALGGAIVMLAAVRGRSLPAMAGLVLLLALCVDMVRRARQRRRVARWIATLWLLSGLTAAGSSYLGLL